MANKTFAGLPAAAALTGAEVIPGLQGGSDVRTTAQAIADLAGTPDAEDVAYDNATSGLTATDVQDALDEIVDLIPAALGDVTAASSITADAVESTLASAFGARQVAQIYAPNNAYLTIVGDFDPAHAKALVMKYFGDIPLGKPVPRPAVSPVTLQTPKRLVFEDRVEVPRLYMLWPTVGEKTDNM